jgi:hypothetical protein
MDCFAPLAMTLRERALVLTPVSLRRPQRGRLEGGGENRTGAYDNRISSSLRPSFFKSFFTALEAAISPWLA